MKSLISLKHLSLTGILIAGVLIAILHTLLFTSYFGYSGWVENYEMRVLDGWFNLRGPKPVPESVIVVSMDEDSYKLLGVPLNQPLPRWVHGKLLKALSRFGAKRAAFDVLFVGDGPDPSSDQELAEGISSLPTVLGVATRIQKDFLVSKGYLVEPFDLFAKRAERLGLVGFSEDNGFVRRFFRAIPDFAAGYVPLSEAAVGRGNISAESPGGRDLINFYGPPETITSIPLYQVIDEDIPPVTKEALTRLFKDKIVFVGLMLNTGLSAEQKDAYLTSFSSSDRTFGVEIHATSAANLLERNWIKRGSLKNEATLLAITTFFMTVMLLGLRPLLGGVVWLGALAVWAIIAYRSFLNGQFIPGAFLFTILLPITFLISSIFYYVITRRSQKRLKRAFDFYISPEMATRLAQEPSLVKLGGEKVEATALFTDIVNFTQISEDLPAEEVAQMLNAYFTEVMDVVFSNQGTLIKFIGDAVFCLWGSPIKIDNHRSKACQTALAIQDEVEKFNATGRFPPLNTRVGINSGPMVVGNLGSRKRFDFTAVGDTVNLGSRVEGLNKILGTKILLTESVLSGLSPEFHTVFIGRISVVGKKQPVGIYTLFKKGMPENELKEWDEAIRAFSAQEWEKARKCFKSFADRDHTLGKAADFYLKQIRILEEDPPSSLWKGELAVASK